MLIVDQLHKRYGQHVALQALDLHVGAGEVYALLGPNGAGKSTTIGCCLGFLRPDGGRVAVDGIDPAIEPDRARQRIAYIPEQVNLYGWFSGLENLRYFAGLGGRDLPDATLRDLLARAGLQADAFDRRASGYSKGMRQKVGVAIALAKEAKLLLLDEPTSGLDPLASNEFSDLLRRLSADGVAILMATHDLLRALDVAGRIGIMLNGRLTTERSAEGLTASELERLYLSQVTAGVS